MIYFNLFYFNSFQTVVDVGIWKADNTFEEKARLLRSTFDIRKNASMDQTVAEEIQSCPPLQQARYVSGHSFYKTYMK